MMNRQNIVVEATTEIKLSKKYQEFADVFDEMNVDKLSEHDSQNHAIKTIEKKSFSFDSIYNLSVTELKVLRKYFNDYLIKK